MAEAAFVLKRLPEVKAQGYFNSWPKIFYEFSDLVGQAPRPMRVLPSPAAISRMEETLTWTVGLAPHQWQDHLAARLRWAMEDHFLDGRASALSCLRTAAELGTAGRSDKARYAGSDNPSFCQ